MKNYMKRLILFSLIFIYILAAGCQSPLRAGVNITKGPSEKFSNEEIDSAIDCVIAQFNKEFAGNKLTDLWYDEERSDTWVDNYPDGKAIALLSNIQSGGSDVCGGFEPNETYSDWCWILTRNSKDDVWKVKTSGY